MNSLAMATRCPRSCLHFVCFSCSCS